MTLWPDEERDSLKSFEEKSCFSPDLQPLYTARGFQSYFAKKESDRIYEIKDPLETHTTVLKLPDQIVILGPYVTTQWDEIHAKIVLANRRVPIDQLELYKIFRCSFPVVDHADVQKVALLILEHMAAAPNLIPIQIDMTPEKEVYIHISEEHNEIEDANQRYKMEHEFVTLLRQGDAQQAIEQWFRIRKPLKRLQFSTAGLVNQYAFATAVRVWVRYAAIQAGLPPVVVDALSQEYAQKMQCAKTEEQLDDLVRKYILVFCSAIRDNQKSNYSQHIKSVIQYIQMNFCHPIRIEDLCKLSDISQQYLSRQFKLETGKTIQQYVMQTRCERAAELLRTSAVPIQKISQSVGYEDTNYFSRVFKSAMGMSPQEYRKQNLFS